MNFHKGFTLIELLVVIAIIGLLSTLAVVSLNSARAKARDAKVMSNLNNLVKALDLYYDDTGAYPSTGGTGVYIDKTSSLTTALSPYITEYPHENTAFASDTNGYVILICRETVTYAGSPNPGCCRYFSAEANTGWYNGWDVCDFDSE